MQTMYISLQQILHMGTWNMLVIQDIHLIQLLVVVVHVIAMDHGVYHLSVNVS